MELLQSWTKPLIYSFWFSPLKIWLNMTASVVVVVKLPLPLILVTWILACLGELAPRHQDPTALRHGKIPLKNWRKSFSLTYKDNICSIYVVMIWRQWQHLQFHNGHRIFHTHKVIAMPADDQAWFCLKFFSMTFFSLGGEFLQHTLDHCQNMI